MGHSANLCDAEYPYHFYCEPNNQKDVFKLKPRGRALTNTLEQMFREEGVPQVGGKKEWVEIETWPKCVADFEGDLVVECCMAMFLMFRNYLWRMREAVGTTGMRYLEVCRRVKQVLLVITPNTMVYFARWSKAIQYLGPKVGYSQSVLVGDVQNINFNKDKKC